MMMPIAHFITPTTGPCTHVQIVREEADYANHILRNWQLQSSAGTSSNPITQELTLNSLGAPQLIAPTHNRMQQQLETKSSSAGAAANGLARNSSSGDKPPTAPGSRAGSKPATAVVDSNGGKEGSRAGSLCSVPRSAVCAAGTANKTTAAAGVAAHNTDHDNNSGSMVSCKTSGSIISMASRPAVTPAGRSVVSCAAKSSRAARSDVSYPQTPNFSQVGSSVATTEVRLMFLVCLGCWTRSLMDGVYEVRLENTAAA